MTKDGAWERLYGGRVSPHVGLVLRIDTEKLRAMQPVLIRVVPRRDKGGQDNDQETN